MYKLVTRWVLGLAAIVGVLAAQPAARAEEKATLVVNLTTDDVWNNQMGLGIAERYRAVTGGNVVVYLNVRAVVLANRKVPQHTGALAGKPMQVVLQELMANGTKVVLCGHCTQQAGLSPDDRLEGIELGGPAFLALLADPKTNILSY